MAKRGMSLREQEEQAKKLERLATAAKRLRAGAASKGDEMATFGTTVGGGAIAGWLDAYQEQLLDDGKENPLDIIEDVPGEGLVGLGIVLVAGGMKKSKMTKRAVQLGSGMCAYSAGVMAKKKKLEAKK